MKALHITTTALRSDVFIVKVAPMNKNGYFNFGPSNSFSKATANRAKIVIVEVNTAYLSVRRT